jgi:hypothetical protein
MITVQGRWHRVLHFLREFSARFSYEAFICMLKAAMTAQSIAVEALQLFENLRLTVLAAILAQEPCHTQ